MMRCTALGVLLAGMLSGCSSAQTPPPAALSASSVVAVAGAHASVNDATVVAFPQHPSLSPDGSTIVYSWAGDLWAVSARGGKSTRLTTHPAIEGRSAFSPDGTLLAFESNRDGAPNIYVMPVDRAEGGLLAGEPRRVTLSDGAHTLGGFSADGKRILFASRDEPSIYRQQRMFSAPVDGGPVELIVDAFGSFVSMSPDGQRIFFQRGYNAWDRPRYRGPGATQLWSYEPASGRFTRITTTDSNEGFGFALPDGRVLFVSSRDGQNNLWAKPLNNPDERSARQLTSFRPEGVASIGAGVRDLDVSRDGRTAVFAVWDTMYTLDLTRQNARPVAITLAASADTDLPATQRITMSDKASEAALSPDGKTIAVVTRGEVFVRSVDEGMPSRRVTRTSGRERDLAWSPDGRYLFFSSDDSGSLAIHRAEVTLARADLDPAPQEPPTKNEEPAKDEPNGQDAEPPADGAENKEEPKKPAAKEKKPDHGERWATALRFEVTEVVNSGANDRRPMPSPCGTKLLLTRNYGDLVVRDLSTGDERVVLEHWDEAEVSWAYDSRHLVLAVNDLDFNADIHLLDTDNPSRGPLNITRHPDRDVSPRLSADGRVLYFLSDRDASQNFQNDVYRVYLDRALDQKRPYELKKYFDDAAAAAKKRAPLAGEWKKPEGFDLAGAIESGELDDAYLRIRRLYSVPTGQGNLDMTPGADRAIFSASIDGSTALFSVDFRGSDRKQIAGGGTSGVGVSLKGDKVTFVSSGRATISSPTGGKTERLEVDQDIEVTIREQQRQKFQEAARTLGTRFYHPTLKGLDWAALTDRYGSLAERTRTNEEFNRVVQLLFGELDGSHTGIRGGDSFSAPSPRVGRLGAGVEPAPGGYRVVSVMPKSPAAHPLSRLYEGDVITAVDGRALSIDDASMPSVSLFEAFAGTAGRETLLDVRRGEANADKPSYVLITPISGGQFSTLAYEHEVKRREAAVHAASGGRLGYLHIRGMDMASVRDFERDLFAAASGREGLVIDVRDNGGGSTTDILLASLTAPAHAYTIPRGADPDSVTFDNYPRDRRLIHGYARPIIVLVNENSFSNAEIFGHAIKTIGRGKIVGTQSFGGVISTGGTSLIDGTFVRVPFRGWYLPDGTDMENNGVKPDIDVPISPADEAAGRDPQLDAAVRALLQEIDSK